MQTDIIKIGISACLAGEKVRFDTGHKKSNFCMDELGKHVEYTRFCPEVAVGYLYLVQLFAKLKWAIPLKYAAQMGPVK